MDRAFERIYRRHAVDVYRYAYAVLRNQADAEDVTQTTFMNAYRALERGETPQAPQKWLIAIAHNVCRQRFRQASRRPLEVGLDDDVADHFVEPEDDTTPGPEDIRRALQHLAFNQRAALVMRELEGRSYAEIADLLELSVGAVETLIFRGRRALREQLEGALTCGQAEQAISRQLDGVLPRTERSQLRAHLRECAACRKIARSQRAQRTAFKALGAVPLPSSLASLFGGGASVGTVVAAKAAVAVVAAGVATGVGIDVHHRMTQPPTHERTMPTNTTVQVQSAPGPAAPSDAPVAAVVVPRAQPLKRAAHAQGKGTHGRHDARPVATTTEGAAATLPPAAVQHTPAAQAASHRQGVAKGRPNGKSHAHGKPVEQLEPSAPARTTPAAGRSRGSGNASGKGNPNRSKGRGASVQVPSPLPPVVPPVTTPTLPVVTVPDAGNDGP